MSMEALTEPTGLLIKRQGDIKLKGRFIGRQLDKGTRDGYDQDTLAMSVKYVYVYIYVYEHTHIYIYYAFLYVKAMKSEIML